MLDTLMNNLANPIHFYGVVLALMVTVTALLVITDSNHN
jgi:hypothetical protein